MAARWFIARNKEKVGPFSAHDLKQLARHGILLASEHIWLEGASKWVRANSVPGLFPPAGEKKFWLMVADQTRGPFVADQVRAGLNSQQFTLQTKARADDSRQWLPLGQLPEFRDFKLDAVPPTPSQARLFIGSLEFEEAALHLAGRNGDDLAKLISSLMDMKRNYANNPALIDSLEATIVTLRAKREEGSLANAEKTKPP